jgi:hypothetical protein
MDAKDDVVVWVRLPKGVNPMEIKELRGTDCYDGDQCIAASSFGANASIVLKSKTEFGKLLEKAGFAGKADCYDAISCYV